MGEHCLDVIAGDYKAKRWAALDVLVDVLRLGKVCCSKVGDVPQVVDVRRDIGPVAAFRNVSVVQGLPKTRSGKMLRKTMRGIADGRDEPVPSTFEDLAVLDALRPILRDGG